MPKESSASNPTRLTCETCSQRKVKCDKRHPCSNCHRSGIQCVSVERKRLPRGRHKLYKEGLHKSNGIDLTDSRSRIEPPVRDPARNSPRNISESSTSLVSANQGRAFGSRSPEHPAFELLGSAAPQTSHLGGFSWTDLIAENDKPLNISDNFPHMGGLQVANPNYSSDSQLLDFNASANAHGLRATPVTKEIREQLCQVYLLRVDPVFKVLHGPSLRDHLLERKKYLNYDPGHPAVEALVSSVYYAATGSLSETQCLSLFAASQAAVITRYQAECEAALGRAGLVATEDLTVLQAFIIFLVTLRSRDQSRRMWTLLSLAVRIAQALSLHIENPPFTMQPFEHEIRRRVWFAIGLLDVQASLDRASQPMIPAAWLQTQLPANINDSDLWFGFEGCLQDSVEFTDMTFTSMTCTAQCIARMLIFPPAAETGATSWNIRQCYVDTFRERAAILLQRCEPRKVPFHWYARQVATYISASLQLLALRPLRRLPKSSAPRVRPHSLLKLAVEVLEQAQHLIKDHRGHAWYWFDSIFVEWHALAVATTEVYICEDKELMEKCWPTIELAFNHFSFLVADSKKGMIWTPVENLMDKARGKLQMVCFNHRAAKEQSADLNTALLEPSTSADVQPHPRSQTSNDTQGADLLMRSVDNLDFAPVLDNTIACQDAWEGVDLTDHGLNPFSDMAWADWESLVDDLNIGDEAVNIFPFHGYSA